MDAEEQAWKPERVELLARVEAAEARAAAAEARAAKAEARVVELEALVKKLLVELEEARRGGKRQAAPFRKSGGPKPNPKMPGRKPGDDYGAHVRREAPAEVDETLAAPLPEACPACGEGGIEVVETVEQYQIDLPRKPIRRLFKVQVGRCRKCGRRVQGRHPLQTSDALGAAAVQLGAGVHAAAVVANKRWGLSHGKVREMLFDLFGVKVARATSARSVLRTAERGEPCEQEVRLAVRESATVVPDETGWRVGGASAWLHVAAAKSAVLCQIAPGRGVGPLSSVLGPAWSGTLVHEGYAAYDQVDAGAHQQCVFHAMRRARELLQTAVRGAVRFPRAVLSLFREALSLRDRRVAGTADDEAVDAGTLDLAARLEKLCGGRFTDASNRRFAGHLGRRLWECFAFLVDPLVDATNGRAGRAIRPLVVNRRVWGGNRTWAGAGAQGVLASLIETLRIQGRSPLDFFASLRRSTKPLRLMPA